MMTTFTRTKQLEQLDRLDPQAARVARIQLKNGLPALAEKTVVDAMKNLLSDPVVIARKAGATHRDTLNLDVFYKVVFGGGPVLQMSVNGTAGDWQRSRFDYAPDWAEAV